MLLLRSSFETLFSPHEIWIVLQRCSPLCLRLLHLAKRCKARTKTLKEFASQRAFSGGKSNGLAKLRDCLLHAVRFSECHAQIVVISGVAGHHANCLAQMLLGSRDFATRKQDLRQIAVSGWIIGS